MKKKLRSTHCVSGNSIKQITDSMDLVPKRVGGLGSKHKITLQRPWPGISAEQWAEQMKALGRCDEEPAGSFLPNKMQLARILDSRLSNHFDVSDPKSGARLATKTPSVEALTVLKRATWFLQVTFHHIIRARCGGEDCFDWR